MKIIIIDKDTATINEINITTLEQFITCAAMLADRITFDVNTMTMQETE